MRSAGSSQPYRSYEPSSLNSTLPLKIELDSSLELPLLLFLWLLLLLLSLLSSHSSGSSNFSDRDERVVRLLKPLRKDAWWLRVV